MTQARLTAIWAVLVYGMAGSSESPRHVLESEALMTTIPYHYISVQSENVISQVGLNGVPLIADKEAEGLVTTEPVNSWVMPSANRFTIHLEWPADRDFVKGRARFVAQLFVADAEAEVPKPGRVLARFVWPDPEIEESYPFDHSIELTSAELTPPPTRLWKEAEKLSGLAESDRREMLALIEGFRASLSAKQAGAAFAFLEYRYADEARAEGKEVARLRDAVLEQYEWMMQQEGELASSPLNIEQARFFLAGGGHVVLVERQDGGDAVVLSNEKQDLEFGIPIWTAKIGGKWTIVR